MVRRLCWGIFSAALFLFLAIGLWSHRSSHGFTTRYPLPVAAMPRGAKSFVIERDDVVGLSGLVVSGNAAYALPERNRAILRFPLDAGGQNTTTPILGIPDALDTESLTLLSNGADPQLFAIGTEEPRKSSAHGIILILEKKDKHYEKREEIIIDYVSIFGGPIAANRGIEGLCSYDNTQGKNLVAAIENVVGSNGQRYAVLVNIQLKGGKQTPFKIKLSTKHGKISGLSCNNQPTGVELTLIERHMDTARIITALWKNEPVIDTQIVHDLSSLGQARWNLEGMSQVDNTLYLITDNYYGEVQGPHIMLRLQSQTSELK